MIRIAHGADLLLACGVRFDDRVTGKVEKFAKPGRSSISTLILRTEQEQAGAFAHRQRREVCIGRLADMIKERPLQKKFTGCISRSLPERARALRLPVTKRS